MKKNPVIGALWRPTRFERRSATTYESLRPEFSADAERLQAAYISGQDQPLTWRMLSLAAGLVAVIVMSALGVDA